jgi:hypothetical protein
MKQVYSIQMKEEEVIYLCNLLCDRVECLGVNCSDCPFGESKIRAYLKSKDVVIEG